MTHTEQLQLVPAPRLPPSQALDIAGKISRHAKFINCQCISGTFAIEPIPKDFDGTRNNHCLQSHGIAVDQVGVRTEFRMAQPIPLPDADPGDQPMMLRVEAAFATAFVFDGEQDAVSRVVYAKVQAMMVAWPYWREFLQSSQARLGMGPQLQLTLLQPLDAARMAGFDAPPLESPKT